MLADPRTRPLRAFLLAAGLLAFSGCTSPSGENQDGVFHAEASDPMIMAPPGTPYDGSGMIRAQGSMLVHTIDETNAGYVNVDLSTDQGMRFSIHWAAFSIQPGQTWQDGGIATNVVEHGSSGQGNKMEPQFNLFSGGWGKGNATMNGGLVVDPVTGSEILNLHYMVTKEAMLEEGSMKVYKSDRRTLFDPKDPGDGYVFPNRPEGHFATGRRGEGVRPCRGTDGMGEPSSAGPKHPRR